MGKKKIKYPIEVKEKPSIRDRKWIISFVLDYEVWKTRVPSQKDIEKIMKGIRYWLCQPNGCFVDNIEGNPVGLHKLRWYSTSEEVDD